MTRHEGVVKDLRKDDIFYLAEVRYHALDVLTTEKTNVTKVWFRDREDDDAPLRVMHLPSDLQFEWHRYTEEELKPKRHIPFYGVPDLDFMYTMLSQGTMQVQYGRASGKKAWEEQMKKLFPDMNLVEPPAKPKQHLQGIPDYDIQSFFDREDPLRYIEEAYHNRAMIPTVRPPLIQFCDDTRDEIPVEDL